MKKRAKIEMYLEVPQPPNFLRISGSEKTISVKEVAEKELRKIGKLWTDQLVLNASKKILSSIENK